MALVVENGTGLALADAFISEADADAYHAANGAPASWTAATSADKEAAIRLATRAMEVEYRDQWRGSRRYATQALSWPRLAAYDNDDFPVGLDSVPDRVEGATAYLALASIDGDTLVPDETVAPISSESVKVGPISIKTDYANSNAAHKRYRFVDRLLSGLLDIGGVNRA